MFSFVFYCKGPRTFGPRDSHRHFIYRLLRGVTNLRISLTGWPPKSDVERGEVLTSRHVTQNLWRFPALCVLLTDKTWGAIREATTENPAEQTPGA